MRTATLLVKIAIPGDALHDSELEDFIDNLMSVNEWYEGVVAVEHKIIGFETTESPCDPGISMTPWNLEQPPEEVIDWDLAQKWMHEVKALLKAELDVDRLADEDQNGRDHGAVK